MVVVFLVGGCVCGKKIYGVVVNMGISVCCLGVDFEGVGMEFNVVVVFNVILVMWNCFGIVDMFVVQFV